jgi:hypothetical protein
MVAIEPLPRTTGTGVEASFAVKRRKKLRIRVKRLGISCDRAATDDWDSFLSAFGEDNQRVGKEHRVGIETVQPLESF